MKKDMTERRATIRQEIVELLKLRPITPFDISGALKISERDAALHLAHAITSASRKHRVEITPAHCKTCGFVFKDRRRTTKPSRCPNCKKGQVESALYYIREGR